MRIAGVHIHSYRGIADLMIPFGRVTVLIGRNGAGKSSVLEAIGFLPSEEGALERRDDEPPTVSWYRSANGSEIADILGVAAAPLEGDRATSFDKIAGWIVVREGHDGGVGVAFDMFRAVLDHPRHHQQPICDRLSAHLERIGTSWSRDLAARLRGADSTSPPFIEFGPVIGPVSSGSPTLFRPNVVSMTTVPDDISPTLLSGVHALAPLAYRELADRRDDVRSALDALAAGRLRPLFELDLLVPLVRMIEHRANVLAPDFISDIREDSGHAARTGLLTIDILELSDTSTGRAVAHLLELAERSDDSEFSSGLLEVASTLTGSGESFDMHLDCSLVAIRDATPNRFPFSRLGTGTRRWVCGAMDEAVRDLAAGIQANPIEGLEADLIAEAGTIADRTTLVDVPRLRLIDEPLESLEADAHRHVLRWLRERSSTSETLVLTSHHSSVLRAAATDDDLEVIGLDRVDGNVEARIFGPSLLKGMRESFAELGLRREDLLFNARALLLLEGPDDVRVMDTVFGDELYEMGVLVNALGGTATPQLVTAFTHSGYELLDLKAWAMFDGTHDDSLPDGQHCASAEASTPTSLQQAASTLGPDRIRLLPFEPTDICLGLTPHCYELAFPDGFRRDGKRLRGDAVLREMQNCASSSDAKALLRKLLHADRDGTFSQAVMTPTLRAIREHGLGRKAANKWLRSSISRLEREISADLA